MLCINCIAAMGVSLLTGFTGIFTLEHAAYMALSDISLFKPPQFSSPAATALPGNFVPGNFVPFLRMSIG